MPARAPERRDELPSTRSDPRVPSLGVLVGFLVVAAGVAVGMRTMSDNSFLTHLATGRLILERGSVPSTDPYTFSAAGEPWVVQSWLMSVAYATAESLGGLDGVRVLSGAIAAGLLGLAWRLLRPIDGLVVRLAVAGLFIAVGAGLWAERPLMVGLLGLALYALAAERGLDPRWLVPVGWVWVNSHGSFPLGLAYLVLLAVGTRLDGERPAHELRCAAWAVAGILLGALGPLGPKVLLFPVELLGRQDLLSNVIEWRAPTFESASQRAFLVQLGLAVVLVARRPRYRSALVVAVFSVAALLGARNLSVASLAMLPTIAPALAGIGGVRSSMRVRAWRPLLIAAVSMPVLVVLIRLDDHPLELGRYPIDALAYLDEEGVDLEARRLMAPDYVGNVIELVYGPGRRVHFDDRFDLFPDDVADGYLDVFNARPAMRSVLEDQEIALGIWPRSGAVARLLVADPDWRLLYGDETWSLVCRRGVQLNAALTC